MCLVFMAFTRLRAQNQILFTDKTNHGMTINFVGFLLLQNTAAE